MAEFIPESRGGIPLLSASGEVDIASVDDFLSVGRRCLEDASALDIDLGGVTFIDSSGLGALVRLHREAGEAGTRLTLVNVPGSVHRLFEITGLVDLFALGTGD